MQYAIRKFRPDEAEAYKAIRLEALELEPGCYGNPWSKEAAYGPSVWQERLDNPLTACFGLYAGDTLIGLTSIFQSPDNPGEGYLTQSYIRKVYRGKGLSSMLYEARIAWARTAGLHVLLVGHRASNLASKAANQRHGFCYSHSEPRIWPDGGEEEMLYYKLMLDD